jgi:hypothetical protein
LGGGSDGSWRGALGIAQRQIPARMAGKGELGTHPPSKLRVWSSVVVVGPPLSWSAPCVDQKSHPALISVLAGGDQRSVDGAEGVFLWSSPLQNAYLLPQRPNLCLKRCPRPDQIAGHPTNEPAKVLIPQQHRPVSRSIASQIRIATGTRIFLAEFRANCYCSVDLISCRGDVFRSGPHALGPVRL